MGKHRLGSTVIALVKKDLRLFVRDRTALFFAFALPIVLASVIGSAMGGMMGDGGSGKPRVGLAVEDRAQNEASRSLVAALEASETLRVVIAEDARRQVADGDRAGGLVIEAGEGANELRLYRDPARQIASQVMLFELAPVLLGEFGEGDGSEIPVRFLDALDFPASGRERAEETLRTAFERMDEIADELEAQGAFESDDDDEDGEGSGEFDPMSAIPAVLGLEVEDLSPPTASGAPRSAGASHAFSSMAVMMLLFNVVAAAGTLLEERQEGTLDRLRLTPAAGRAVLIGKALMTMILALVQLVVLFTFGALVYGVPVLEHLPAIALTSLVWAFTASSLGLLFATACSTRKQLEGVSTLVVLGMSAVGGAWFPREITPEWFQTAGLVTPVAWAMDCYEGALWYGKGIFATAEHGGILGGLGVLVGIGIVLTVISFALYRRRYRTA